MRRILATSIAAAIPAVLPVSAVNAYSKPAPPPTASGHYKARAHGHGRTHGRPAAQGRNSARPVNAVKVDADDGGAPQGGPDNAAPQNAAPEHGPARAHGGHSRPTRPARSRPAASRPGTGADSGFADADDLALPPEAAQAIREAEELQKTGGQAGDPGTGAPQGAPVGAPQAPGAAPAAPTRPGGAARPQAPVADESTNKTSGRKAARPNTPVAFFTGSPARNTRLVLHATSGTSPERTVTLQCYPTGGTHPKAAQACADVARAGGDLAQIPGSAHQRACFMIYSPVTVTAQGQWQGQNVRYTKKFPNTCVMRDKTGSVFDF